MTLCSEKHTEVCFESTFCPACELIERIEELEEENGELVEQVKALEK
jgi:hypothetical protein